MKAAHLVVLAGSTLALAECGYNRGDRALSGGLLGAAGGAGIAALTGGSPLAGAAVGGAVTSGHSLNLGRPVQQSLYDRMIHAVVRFHLWRSYSSGQRH